MREKVETNDAPKAIGPYSQAIIHNGLVFLSGQIPLDPATGEIVSGDIRAQTHRVMKNLDAVLRASHSSFGDVVRSTIYLTNLSDFTAVNEVYATYFGASDPPARSTIQVAALPRGAQVEIDMIATVRR